MSFERKIEFSPAFDRRSKEPNKNYGVHGVEMRWLLIGEKGAIQFLLYTNWMLPHVQEEQDARPVRMTYDKESREAHVDRGLLHLTCHPLPADIGYHAYTPQYEGHEPTTTECSILGGKPCYYDGSGLRARDFYALLVAQGGDALWAALEKEYAETFERVTA